MGDTRTMVVSRPSYVLEHHVFGQWASQWSRQQFISSFMAEPTQGGSLSLEPLCQYRRPSAFSLAKRSERLPL